MTTTVGSLTFVIDGKPAEAGAQVVVRSIQSIRDAAKKVGAESSNELGKLGESFKKLSDIRAPSSDVVQRLGAFAAMARQMRSITAPSDDVINKLNNFFNVLGNLKAPSTNALSRLAAVAPVLSTLQGLRAPSASVAANFTLFFDALANAKTPRAGLIQAIQGLSGALSGKFTAPGQQTTQNLVNFFQALGTVQVPRNLNDIVSALNNIALAANNAGQALRGLRSGLSGLNAGGGAGGAGHLNNLQNGFRGVLAAGTPLHHMLFQTRAAFQGFFAALGIRELVQVNIQIQQVTAALVALTGSAREASGQFSFIMNLSNRFGVDITTAASGYKRLLAAIEGTTFTTEDAQKMFTNISKAARVLGLDSENTMGVFRALEQIMSKGSLQAEELRGQLGDRLPGAFNMFAKAMGVSTAELGKLMKDGKITGDVLHDSLIKFTDLYAQKVEGGMAQATQMMQAELSRLMNSVKMASVAIGEGGFNEAVAQMARSMTSFLEDPRTVEAFRGLGAVILWVQENFASLATLIGGMFLTKFLLGTQAVSTFIAGVRTFGPMIGYTSAAVTGLSAGFAGLAAAAKAAALSFAAIAIPAAIASGIVYIITRTDELTTSTEQAVAATRKLLDLNTRGDGRTAYAVEQAVQESEDRLRKLESELRLKQEDLRGLQKRMSEDKYGGRGDVPAFDLMGLFDEHVMQKGITDATKGIEVLKEAIAKLREEAKLLRDQESFKDAFRNLQDLQDQFSNSGNWTGYDRAVSAMDQLTNAFAQAMATGNMEAFKETLKGINDEIRRMSGPAGDAASSLEYVMKTAFPDLAKKESMDKQIEKMRAMFNGTDGKGNAVSDQYRQQIEKATGLSGQAALDAAEKKLRDTLSPNKKANANAQSLENSFENLRASLGRVIDDLAKADDASENFFSSVNKRGSHFSQGQIAQLSALRDMGVVWKDTKSSADELEKAIQRVNDGSEISTKEILNLANASLEVEANLDRFAVAMNNVNLEEDKRNKAAEEYSKLVQLQLSAVDAMTGAVQKYKEALAEQNAELRTTMGIERAQENAADSAFRRRGVYDPRAIQESRDAELADFDRQNNASIRQMQLKMDAYKSALANENLRPTDRVDLQDAMNATQERANLLSGSAGERRENITSRYAREEATALRELRSSADSAREGQETFNDTIRAYQDLLKQGKINEQEYTELFQDSRLKMLESQKDFASGAERAMLKYSKSLGDHADMAERFFTRSFQNMEDALTDFVATGKLNFRGLMESMIQDLARLQVQMSIMEPLKGMFGGIMKGGFSFFSDMFGGGGGGVSQGAADLHASSLPWGANSGITVEPLPPIGGSAHGNVFSAANDNAVYRFARGSAFSNAVVDTPTYFRFANGGSFGRGMMGEAGPEAVVPLKRTASGNLGVEVAGGTGGGGGVVVQIIDQRSGNAPAVKTQNGGVGPDGRRILRVMIQEENKRSMGSGEMDTSMKSNYGIGRVGVNRG